MGNAFSRLIDVMVSKSKIVNYITIGITILGLLALYFTKRDLHPPFEFNQITISVQLPEASPAEIERLVTYPIEEQLLKMKGLNKITSRNDVGQARIRLSFKDEVHNLLEKETEVRNLVQYALKDLPTGVSSVFIQQDSVERNQIFLANYGLIGIDEKNHQHHQFVNELKRKLLSIGGVTKVETSLRPLHIYIVFNQKVLEKASVSPSLIKQAIKDHYDFQSISYYNNQGEEWLLELDRTPMTLEQISSIRLFQNAEEKNLKIGDVAKVEWKQAPLTSYNYLLNGSDATELIVFKDTEHDSIDLFKVVRTELEKIKLPDGVSLKLLYDGPYFIQQQISVLVSNGFGGLILVLVMLALAMSWKTSLMTALGLPISYFGTFIILKAFGASIDLISMIAMILVVGNLVDDAVIMAERYTQLLEEGIAPEKAATTAAKELILPVTGTILTIICAFIPMLFVEGNLSKVFAVIPIVIGASLFLSWFETFFILPNHLAHYVRTPPKLLSQKLFFHLARYYRKALGHTLKFRYLYALASVILLIVTVIAASKMPQDFSLSINAPQVEVFAEFSDGTTLDQAQKNLGVVHRGLSEIKHQDVDFIETNIGWVWRQGKAYRGPKYTTVRLVLDKSLSDPAKARDEIFKIVQNKIEEIKKENPIFVRLEASANERGSGNRVSETVTVKVSGKDETAFAKVEQELIQQLPKKGQVGNYILPDDHSPLTIRFIPARGRITALQMNPKEVAFQLQAQTSSVELLKTRHQGEWIYVMLEPEKIEKPNIQNLKERTIFNPSRDAVVPLSHIGGWKEQPPMAGISHEAGERILLVQFAFDSKTTNEQVVKKEIEAQLAQIRAEYPQLKIETEDSNESDKKGREWILKIVLASALLIYIILATVLRSYFLPLIVGLPIPFAMVGVIWALKLHDLPLGLMSMIGLIGTMGVAVNDSIVMVDQIHRLKKKFGFLTQEIIIDGAASRMRAISLTASCTLIGVFPTAYGIGGESGFTQPLAFSMGWGLLTSLFLTLFVIPGMLQVFEDIRRLFSRKKKNEMGLTGKPTPSSSVTNTEVNL